MTPNKIWKSADVLAIASIMTIAVLTTILGVVAATTPADRTLLTMVIVGLVAGGLILFRELRKTANSLIASEARAYYAATHDPLTQLPNTALFLDRLVSTHEGGCVIKLSVDHFNEVAEVLGHLAADALIVEFTSRLTALCREADTLAKSGDDSFALFIPGSTRAQGERLCLQVLELLSRPYEAAGAQTVVTASIGVAFFTPGLDRPEETLRQSQLALADAKKMGGMHHCFYDPAMDRALKTRKAMEMDLRGALLNGVLTMAYQPQFNEHGVMTGVEALMRWTDPVRGPVSPAVFVPLAESCGLSEALDRFALKSAFDESKRWPGLKVAINVSAMQVRTGGLIGILKGLLEQTGANPKNMELEITEGVLLADEPETFDTLNAVRKLGFALALDDFGTGYSSLSYLRRFPIDKIKIDRSFVAHLGQRPESDAIVRAIVDMAEALELKVIAEGVETRAQVDRLAIAGCTDVQGFFFSPAIAPAAIDAMMTARSKAA